METKMFFGKVSPIFSSSSTVEAFVMLACSVLLFILLTLILKPRKPQRKSTRVIPQFHWTPIKIPLLDGVISLLQMRILGVAGLAKIWNDLGNTMKVPFLHHTLVATRDVKVIQKLLSSSNPGHLSKPLGIYSHVFPDLLIDGLICSQFPLWNAHRKAIAPAFTYKSFPIHLEFIKEACITMSNNACIAADILMGSNRCDISDDNREKLYTTIAVNKEAFMKKFEHPYLFIPLIWRFHPLKRVLDDTSVELQNFFGMVIEKCRTKLADQTQHIPKGQEFGVKAPTCLIDQMINSRMSNKEITNESLTMLAAGYDTTIKTINMVNFFLASNPEHQKLCQQEVDEYFESLNDESEINIENLSQLKIVERNVLESLRITPVLPFFIRRLDAPLEIEEDFVLEAGERVLVSPWVVHRNPDIYPNPEKFDPDRFLPENVKQRSSYAYIPFSMGNRNCIGFKIAILELKLLTAFILRNFSLSTDDKFENVKLYYDISIKLERPYNVKFIKREIARQ